MDLNDLNLDNDVFTEDQQKVLLSLVQKMDEGMGDKVKEELRDAAVTDDDLNLSDSDKQSKQDRLRLDKMEKIWRNNGYIPGTDRQVEMEELLKKDMEVTSKLRMQDNWSSDHPLLIPRVISNFAREAIEPNLTLTPLLSRLNYSAGTRIVFPSWGAITAADLAEGEEYPEKTMELAGQVEATIGKSGVAIKVSEEMMRYSQFDVVSMHVRAAGKALARLKEQKVVDLITADYGNAIFDNEVSTVKTTTGRDDSGAYNGTLTLDDLFYAYAVMVDRGFPANTLIMHPFAWQIFAEEAISRAFGFVNGVSPLMWQTAQGSPGNAGNPWRVGGLNQNTYVTSPEEIATTFTQVPSIFPTNFSIVVSPYMPYDASTNRTDIVFCDRNELGILVVDEEVVTDQWDDPSKDIRKIKFRERYGLAVQNDGNGIGLMKHIKIGKGYDFADKITYQITGLTNPLSHDPTGTTPA